MMTLLEICCGSLGAVKEAVAAENFEKAAELPDGLVQAGRIQEDQLAARVGDNAAHRVARRLLDGRDDRDLFPDEGIDERGLPRVRPPDDTNNGYSRHG